VSVLVKSVCPLEPAVQLEFVPVLEGVCVKALACLSSSLFSPHGHEAWPCLMGKWFHLG